MLFNKINVNGYMLLLAVHNIVDYSRLLCGWIGRKTGKVLHTPMDILRFILIDI